MEATWLQVQPCFLRVPLGDGPVVEAVGITSALFIPQILVSISSTIGFSLKSMKTIFFHIELLILPSGIVISYIFVSCRDPTV